MKERLSASDLREVEEDTYLVVKLHDDEYWQQGEGRVSYVKENSDGSTHIGITGSRGHPNTLKVPADARKGLTYDGAASGARNLRVTKVYKRGKSY